MKPKTFNKKLAINKRTVANLGNKEMNAVNAAVGIETSKVPICWVSCLGSCEITCRVTCDTCTCSVCQTQCGSGNCC